MNKTPATLHPMVAHWVAAQGWSGLRPLQEQAIQEILSHDSDVLIRAGTASGKTEAAFLPLVSQILQRERRDGTICLCISPMKALINDQFDRLDKIGMFLDISVQRWHGDVPATAKRKARDVPPELLIITPESLEAQLLRRGYELASRFANLDAVVIDELHLFIGRQRGAQVESQLTRLARLIGHRPRRIGLSATLGDTREAMRFLSSGSSLKPVEVEVEASTVPFRWNVVIATPPHRASEHLESELDSGTTVDDGTSFVADEIVRHAPHQTYLVFANSKNRVESVCDELVRRSIPIRVAPHHGSLSKTVRAHAEQLLCNRDERSLIVATSTLEVGIDVPAVSAVGQIEAPTSVATLRQRLGRSGRRADPSQIDIFLPDPGHIDERTPVADRLRPSVLQALACLELALEGWAEPIEPSPAQWSTMVQQVVSTICERGGASAAELFEILVPTGPFQDATPDDFGVLLRHLGASEILRQDDDGTLLLGREGEHLAYSASFCAVFETPVEYLVMSKQTELGSLIRTPWLAAGQPLIFAGKRWLIVGIDDGRRTIDLDPSGRGKLPVWTGSAQPVHRVVRERMERISRTGQTLAGVDERVQDLVDESLAWYRRLNVEAQPIVATGASLTIIAFGGTRETENLAAILRSQQIQADVDGIAITVSNPQADRASIGAISDALETVSSSPPTPAELVPFLVTHRHPKHHDRLPPELQQAEIQHDALDLPGAVALAERILRRNG